MHVQKLQKKEQEVEVLASGDGRGRLDRAR